MADKPEFVDMISEATRQMPAQHRRASSISSPSWSRTPRVSVTGPERLEQWRLETLHAVEDQALEIQELGLSVARSSRMKNRRPNGRLFCFRPVVEVVRRS